MDAEVAIEAAVVTTGGDESPRPPWWRRAAPVVALMALAPWAAECSWGGFSVLEFPLVVAVLAPLYGGAAVLIREVARRTGAGWPGVVLLAAAFGVVQAGLVDQSMFNPAYLADTEFAGAAATARATWVPGLEFSAQQAFTFVGNHIALSICAPIAIVESYRSPRQRGRPWLGVPGIAVVAVLYLLGSLLIFYDDSGRNGFQATAGQLTFAALAGVGFLAAAFLPRWRRSRPAVAARAPRLLWVGLLVVVARWSELGSGWGWFALQATVTGLVVAVVVGWSRRTGWGQGHVLAAWGACLVSAAAAAYVVPSYAPVPPTLALVSDLSISVVTVALLSGAYQRLVRFRPAARPG